MSSCVDYQVPALPDGFVPAARNLPGFIEASLDVMYPLRGSKDPAKKEGIRTSALLDWHLMMNLAAFWRQHGMPVHMREKKGKAFYHEKGETRYVGFELHAFEMNGTLWGFFGGNDWDSIFNGYRHALAHNEWVRSNLKRGGYPQRAGQAFFECYWEAVRELEPINPWKLRGKCDALLGILNEYRVKPLEEATALAPLQAMPRPRI